MDCTATRISYRQTGFFSPIVLDYLDNASSLRPFYAHRPDVDGMKQAIEARQQFDTNRSVLVQALKEQYAQVNHTAEVAAHIEALQKDTTFTITTAHQPNIFTGPLYFIYKILHVIRVADSNKTLFPEYDFVPVYYMGSEDADLDELGHFYIQGEKKVWATRQTGAVGRMKVDKQLVQLIEDIAGQVSVLPAGEDLLTLIRDCYQEGVLIQDATFRLVNALFGEYGLIVLIPDNPLLKQQAAAIFNDDLLNQPAAGLVEKTAKAIHDAGYKVQAHPREINLFYLTDGIRNRIEATGDGYQVVDTDIHFSKDRLLEELEQHPERFSPNVILRGLFQETILPNIAFAGGGGELAYWLQLKDLFAHYKVPYPVLLVRNSFLLLDKKWENKKDKLGFSLEEIFLPEAVLLNKIVERDSKQHLQLNGLLEQASALYDKAEQQAAAIDATLHGHVEALKTKALHRLQELEKKMLRAEKRKFGDQQRQIQALKQALFPHNNLQERIDNFIPYYGQWGKTFIQTLYQYSLGLEQEMVVLSL